MVCWQVLGGAESGGILVRKGKELKSPVADGRLATGSVIKEEALEGERLKYSKVKGDGPEEGWVSILLKGKILVERIDDDEDEDVPDFLLQNAADMPDGERPLWIEESIKKIQAWRDGTKFLPPTDLEVPQRLRDGDPLKKVQPFKRLSHKDMEEMSPKNLPGMFSEMKFPHTTEQLRSFGAEWFTKAFHKFGTIPADNSVKRVVSVEELPISGFDAAGGAGHKAFITVEYAKPDPNLHTKLFAKFPWDYFESAIGKQYRMQISTYSDMDIGEVLVGMCCEHLLPFRMPKWYFADLNRDTTNYLLITECIPFGKRGKVVKGKIVEKIKRKPFEILPVCGKYQDYLLEDAPKIYYTIFRSMAHLAAWDQCGHYDSFLGTKQRYTDEDTLEKLGQRKPGTQKKKEMQARATRSMCMMGIPFATEVAPWLFTPAGRDKDGLERMVQVLGEVAAHRDDIMAFLASSSDFIAAMHLNLQADNAYFWADENGDLDMGAFDWCGFNRNAFVMNFTGCLSGADADLLDAHDEGLMTTFCKEYERYGGPHVEPKDLLLRYHLSLPSTIADSCQWIERDVYVESPKEDWKGIKSILDPKFVDRWNTRCRVTTMINAFDFFPRRDFKKILEDWKASVDPRFITKYPGD